MLPLLPFQSPLAVILLLAPMAVVVGGDAVGEASPRRLQQNRRRQQPVSKLWSEPTRFTEISGVRFPNPVRVSGFRKVPGVEVPESPDSVSSAGGGSVSDMFARSLQQHPLEGRRSGLEKIYAARTRRCRG